MNLHLAKNINYMVLAQAANYALPLLLIPYLVRTLGLGGFGDFSVAQSIISVGLILVQFGFNIYVTKDIAEKTAKGRAIDDVISATFSVQIILAVVLIVLASVVYAVHPVRVAQLSLWYSLAWLGQALFPVWYFQGTQSFKQLAGLNFSLRASTFVLVLAFIKSEEHLLFLPMIYSFSYISTGVYACLIMWRRHTWRLPTVWELRALVSNTKDVFVSSMVSVMLMNMPILFLSHQASKEEVGAFSAILRVIYAIKGMLNSGFQVLIPALVSERNRLDHRRIGLKVVLIVAPIVTVAMLLKEPFLAMLYGQQAAFNNDLGYFVLCFSVIPGSLATLYVLVFATYYGDFTLRKRAFMWTLVITGVLYYPSIYLLNGLGAALTFLIGEITLLIWGYRVVRNNNQVG